MRQLIIVTTFFLLSGKKELDAFEIYFKKEKTKKIQDYTFQEMYDLIQKFKSRFEKSSNG